MHKNLPESAFVMFLTAALWQDLFIGNFILFWLILWAVNSWSGFIFCSSGGISRIHLWTIGVWREDFCRGKISFIVCPLITVLNSRDHDTSQNAAIKKSDKKWKALLRKNLCHWKNKIILTQNKHQIYIYNGFWPA